MISVAPDGTFSGKRPVHRPRDADHEAAQTQRQPVAVAGFNDGVNVVALDRKVEHAKVIACSSPQRFANCFEYSRSPKSTETSDCAQRDVNRETRNVSRASTVGNRRPPPSNPGTASTAPGSSPPLGYRELHLFPSPSHLELGDEVLGHSA
jgi:hypothetical protein